MKSPAIVAVNTPLERKQIENQMISGELMGLVSTNALELGIDIGKISTTVLVGYPGTRASFWQQTGVPEEAGKGAATISFSTISRLTSTLRLSRAGCLREAVKML